MTRSIFDPTGNPERSGSRFTPPDADQISHLPREQDEDAILRSTNDPDELLDAEQKDLKEESSGPVVQDVD